MKEKETIGQRIRKIRKIKGLSQSDLSKFMGIVPQHVGKMERGETNLNHKHISKLVEKLGVSAEWLLLEKGEMFLPEQTTDAQKILEENKRLHEIILKLNERSLGLEEKEKKIPALSR